MGSLPEKKLRLEELMPLIREQLEAGKSVRFAPRGVSMLPMLRQGRDKVILSPVKGRLKKYDLPLYQRDNGQYVLHRIVGVGETYTCIGDNQYALEHGIRQDQLIAVVTAFVRDDREIPVTDLGYRIYCRLWHCFRPIKRVLGRCRRILFSRL